MFARLLNSFFAVSTVYVLLSSSSTSSAESVSCAESPPSGPCNDLSGIWKNELGSEMHLNKINDNCQMTGWYQTAVESKEGAAGKNMTADLIAARQPKSGVFSLVTLWAGGSVTAWTGQCYENSDGKEELKTTWLLRSPTESKTEWMSTRIGTNFFTRKQE